jgi:hypothetical protein
VSGPRELSDTAPARTTRTSRRHDARGAMDNPERTQLRPWTVEPRPALPSGLEPAWVRDGVAISVLGICGPPRPSRHGSLEPPTTIFLNPIP